MRIVAALSVVYICGLCIPVSATGASDQSPFTLSLQKEDGVSVVKCRAVEGHATATLAFDGIQIWNGEQGDECSSAVLYFDGDNHPKLLQVDYVNASRKPCTLYRYNDRSTWKNIDKSGHNSMLDTLKSEAKKRGPQSTSDPSTLDITKPEEDYLDVTEQVAGELKTYTYTPKGGVAISMITCGTYTIARLNTGENFKSGVLYLKNNRSPLFYLVASKPGGTDRRYFGRVNGAWQTFSREKFEDQLAEMKQNSVGYILDISRAPESSKVVMTTDNSNGLRNNRYQPKSNVQVNSIVDGHIQIWNSDGDGYLIGGTLSTKEDSPSLLQVQIQTLSTTQRKYFKKQDGAWTSLTKTSFTAAMDQMTTGASGVILGLANVDKTKIKIVETTRDGITKKTYSSKNNKPIVAIVDGSNDIWLDSNEETFDSVHEYFRSGHPKLLHLNLVTSSGGNKSRHFKKCGGRWNTVGKNDFDQSLEDMKKGPGLNSLDISQPKRRGSAVNVTETAMGTGALQKIFEIDDDADITSVSEDSRDIWSASANEKCVGATLHSKSGTTILSLDLRDGERFFNRNYEKENDLWREVDESTYTEKLDEIADLPDSGQDGSTLRGNTCRFTINPSINMSKDRVSVSHPTESHPYMTVNALAGTLVTRVTDGRKTVWQRRQNEQCLTASFFMKGREPLLAKLVIKDGLNTVTQYFKKTDNIWSPTNLSGYQECIREHAGGEPDDEYDEDEDAFLTSSMYSIVPLVIIALSITLF